MAKVIRTRYVYKKFNRNHQYLPRRDDRFYQQDFEKNHAMPSDFNEPMEVDQPPKLWLVWAYRQPVGQRAWTKERLKQLFGELPEPGKMHVFKNTADINDLLWHVKHLIEVRPITFPNGEPTTSDVAFTELHADGRCVVDHKSNVDHSEVELFDKYSQFSPGYLSKFLKRRDALFKDVYPDNVYNPSNITIVD